MYTRSVHFPPLQGELLAHWSLITETLLLYLGVDDAVLSSNPAARRWCQADLEPGTSWWPACPEYARTSLQGAVASARLDVTGDVLVAPADQERSWSFRVTRAPGGILLEGRDVTDQQRLQEQVAWWETCFEVLPVAVTYYDVTDRQRFGNAAYRALLGTLAPPRVPPALECRTAAAPVDVSPDTVCVLRGERAQQHLSLRSCPVERHGVRTGDLVTVRDVTRDRRLERRLTYQATHDELTGLLNRSALTAARVDRTAYALNTVIFIDLDEFKAVNDTLGHAAGDLALQTVARRLNRWQDAGDLVVRWGGDEFVALIRSGNPAHARRRARALLAALRQPMQVGTHTVSIAASIGVVRADPRQRRVADLIARADAAMYTAKTSGKDRVVEVPAWPSPDHNE